MRRGPTGRLGMSYGQQPLYDKRLYGVVNGPNGPFYQRRGTAEGIAKYGMNATVATLAQRAARREDGWRGQGMYTGRGGFWDSAAKGWDQWRGRLGAGFKAGASAMGFGGAADALTAAENAGRAIGLGAYQTNALVNAGSGAAEGVPEFSPDGSGVIVSHREYISDVFGTPAGTSFHNQQYSINPGLESTFPWLAQIAQNYDEYSIKQLIFTFRSSIAPIGASSSGQVGTIIMATQYNAGEDSFTNKETMMQYDGAMSAKVIDGLLSGVECDPSKMSGSVGKYTRAGPPPPGEDIKTYDLGNFNIAVTNIPAAYENQSLGELWVSYTVELRKPKFFAAQGFGIARDTFVQPKSSITTFKHPFPQATLSAGNQLVTPGPLGGQLLGQQNNIGVVPFSELTASADKITLGVLFPATCAGNFKIKIVLFSSTMLGNQLDSCVAAPNGNIRFIKDSYTTSNTTAVQAWTSGESLCGYGETLLPSSFTSCTTIEFNVAVSIASGGHDNWASIGLTYVTGTAAAAGAWTSATCDVSEYNTSFNYKQDGSNDQIMLVNSGGQLVVP